MNKSRLHASRPAYPRLATAALLGLVARLSLAVRTPPQHADAAIFSSWAKTFHDYPLNEFYAFAWRPDHLPGDLWFLKVLQMAFTTFASDFGSPAFGFLLKTVPVISDLLVGVLLFRLVRIWASEHSAVRAAQWYLLNPAVIMLSAIWGQWDALSVAIVLSGFLMVARGRRSWVWAAPCLVWALLIKPPLVIFEVVILLWLLVGPEPGPGREPPARGRWLGAWFAGLGTVTAVALLAPFRVGVAWVPDGGWSLVERVRFAADVHPVTTVGAANIWMMIDRRAIGRSDEIARWGSVNAGEAATILFLLMTCAIAAIGWLAFEGKRRSEALLWSAATASFGSCLILTRAHERYYFPALVLVLLWASTRGLDLISAGFFWSFSVLFMVDLAGPTEWAGHLGTSQEPAVLVLLGLLHVVYFIALLLTPWLTRTPDSVTAGAPSAANAARRTAPG